MTGDEVTGGLSASYLPPPLVVTAGEPAGIGPDLCVLLARSPPPFPLVILADRDLIAERARQLGLPFDLPEHGSGAPLSLLHEPLAVPARAGRLEQANAGYVLAGRRRPVPRVAPARATRP